MKLSQNGQPIAVIIEGPENAPSILMLHGGPGYHWLPKEIKGLSHDLSGLGTGLRIHALQGRGCGIGEYLSPYQDLLDDNLYKRAEDLKAFENPDIILGHSTGAMVALTAVIEGFVKPKKLILLSPYTASLGEHAYWVNQKAKKYPAAFMRYKDFVENKWQEHVGQLPEDLQENLYINWGKLYFLLPDEDKIKANLHYLDFHVIDSSHHVGLEGDEPYTRYKIMLENFSDINEATKSALLRMGTINAHWWKTNFQDGYPFLEKLKEFNFNMPIYILSGEKDEITPPSTVKELASVLKAELIMAPDACHLPETDAPGDLKDNLVKLLKHIV